MPTPIDPGAVIAIGALSMVGGVVASALVTPLVKRIKDSIKVQNPEVAALTDKTKKDLDALFIKLRRIEGLAEKAGRLIDANMSLVVRYGEVILTLTDAVEEITKKNCKAAEALCREARKGVYSAKDKLLRFQLGGSELKDEDIQEAEEAVE